MGGRTLVGAHNLLNLGTKIWVNQSLGIRRLLLYTIQEVCTRGSKYAMDVSSRSENAVWHNSGTKIEYCKCPNTACARTVWFLTEDLLGGFYHHGRWHQICTYPKLIRNTIVMLSFSDEFVISSNRLPYLKFVNRFATITNSIAKFWVFFRDKCYCVAEPMNLCTYHILSFSPTICT